MKARTGLAILLGALAGLLVVGCDICDPCCDGCAPPPPGGVNSTTGDGYVEIFWNEVHVADLAGYRVYWSDEEFGPYERIGSTTSNSFVDHDVENGVTYFYAVSAFDHDGNESELSYETCFDTPRPAGRNLTVYDLDELAGVDFSEYDGDMVLPWDDPYADMYLVWLGDRYGFESTDGNDLMYGGYCESLDELGWAPDGGWTVGEIDVVSLREGQAYWVWTWDNHFAKFRITHIGDDFVILDWAYQTDEGNPELSIVTGGGEGGAPAKSFQQSRDSITRDGERPSRASYEPRPVAETERR